MKSGPVAQAKSSVLLEVIVLSLAHDLRKKEGWECTLNLCCIPYNFISCLFKDVILLSVIDF